MAAYRTILLRIVAVSVCIIITANHLSAENRKNPADLPNVIVITLSGVRNSETISDPTHQYIPDMWNNVLPAGTLYDNLEDLNVTFHMPAFQATNTGEIYGTLFGNYSSTIFYDIGRKYDIPPEKIWSIGQWFGANAYCSKDGNKLYPSMLSAFFKKSDFLDEILSKRELKFFKDFKALQDKIGATWPLWDSSNIIIWEISKKIFRKYKPQIVHYVMNNTESAHFGSYPRYVNSIKAQDDAICEIFNMINEDPYYKGKTYLIVNIDHSRDDYYMQHYYTKETVWMYIYGPGIKRGEIINRKVHHIDVYATLRYIFGMEKDDKPGSILKDCFIEAPAETR